MLRQRLVQGFDFSRFSSLSFATRVAVPSAVSDSLNQQQLDSIVAAGLERTQTVLADGEERVTWRLVALDPLLPVLNVEQVRAQETGEPA